MLIEQDSCFPGPKNRHVLETDMITAVLPGIRAYYFFLSKVRLQDCEIYVLQSRHFWLEIPLEKKIIIREKMAKECASYNQIKLSSDSDYVRVVHCFFFLCFLVIKFWC